MRKGHGLFLLICILMFGSIVAKARTAFFRPSPKTPTANSTNAKPSNKRNNPVAPTPAANARDIVRAGIEAMGGEEKLRALRSVKLEGSVLAFFVDQVQVATGECPMIVQDIVELHDLTGNRFRMTAKSLNTPNAFSSSRIVTDEFSALERNKNFRVDTPGGEEWTVLVPERLLVTAFAAPDLRLEPDAVVRGIAYNAVTYTWHGIPIHLFLHKNGSLPVAVELTRPWRRDAFGTMGDVTTRIFFDRWTVERNGIRYPHLSSTHHNGLLVHSVTLRTVEFDAPLPDDAFTVPDNIKAAYREMVKSPDTFVPPGMPGPSELELTPEIVTLTDGGMNTTIIKQNDGIVILEAPLSSAHSIDVIAKAQRRFPGLPIKAVVSSASTWVYFGGLREYAARGIPIYLLDLHQSVVKQLMDAPFRTNPDALASHPKRPDIRIVNGKTVIGDGANRIELFPSHTNTERMMAYFPGQRLLYGSDLASNFNFPQWQLSTGPLLLDFQEFAKRENLTVDRAFGLHTQKPFAWSELESALTNLLSGKWQ
jgi:hypothetical protein